jgi:hypothetical protein
MSFKVSSIEESARIFGKEGSRDVIAFKFYFSLHLIVFLSPETWIRYFFQLIPFFKGAMII